MKYLLFAAALSTSTMLLVAGTAWAHVAVTPEEVPAGEFETLTASVPTEKEIPTTKVRVEVPEGFTIFGVQPVPGWDYRFEEDGGLITAITWSDGEIGPQEFQQFLISAQAPDDPGEYPWRAFQTYQDGSVVEWTGPPDAEEPAPVVKVASAITASGGPERGAGEPGSHREAVSASASALPDSGGTNAAVYGASLGACVLAVGVGLTALLHRAM